jgi:FkbM family methyltransferase
MNGSGFTRWHAAGLIRRHVPDVRGRDRLVRLVMGAEVPRSLRSTPQAVHFGPGLVATVPLTADGSFEQVFLAAYSDPALVPVLRATLRPGAVFYDVGANVGIYTLWASRLVGAAGRVRAFEPVPDTARWLNQLIAENGADNVEWAPVAVSDRAHTVVLETVAHASGLSHVTPAAPDDGSVVGPDAVQVEAVVLDDFVDSHDTPTLVKIDVEGHELAVFRGMGRTLEHGRPVVVFEAPDTVGATGDTATIVALLGDAGYRVWSLTSRGLAPYRADDYSHNLLALHPEDHAAVLDDLRSTRFARNQNC